MCAITVCVCVWKDVGRWEGLVNLFQQFMRWNYHRNRLNNVWLSVFVCKQTDICPFDTSESHANWPCVSVRDIERSHCLLCRASDAIAANVLTGLLCRELPEDMAPLHMKLSASQLGLRVCDSVHMCILGVLWTEVQVIGLVWWPCC